MRINDIRTLKQADTSIFICRMNDQQSASRSLIVFHNDSTLKLITVERCTVSYAQILSRQRGPGVEKMLMRLFTRQ